MKSITMTIILGILFTHTHNTILESPNTKQDQDTTPTPDKDNNAPEPKIKKKKFKNPEDDIKQSCNMVMVDQFFPNPILRNASPAEKEITKLCPTIKMSCCLPRDVKQQAHGISIKGRSLDIFVERYSEILDTISSLTDENMKILRGIMAISGCRSEANLSKSRDFVFLHLEKMKARAEFVVDHYRRLAASFFCAMCGPRIGDNLLIDDTTQKTNLIISSDFCVDFFEPSKSVPLITFYHDLNALNPFVILTTCLYRQKKELDQARPEALFKMDLDALERCSKGKHDSRILETVECLEMCRQYNPLNANALATTNEKISLANIYLKQILQSDEFKDCVYIDGAPSPENCLYPGNIDQEVVNEQRKVSTFQYYMEVNPATRIPLIQKLSWRIFPTEGIDFVEYPFAEFNFVGRTGLLVLAWLLTLSPVF